MVGSSTRDDGVTVELRALRDLIELKYAACEKSEAEIKERIDLERKIADERFHGARVLSEERQAFLNKALELQAEENKRRLGDLNHAHQQLQADREMNLPRETFGRFEASFMTWKDEVNKKMATTINWSVLGALILGFATIAGVVVSFFRR